MNGSAGSARSRRQTSSAVDFRHHDVEQDKVRNQLRDPCQRTFAVGGDRRVVVEAVEPRDKDLAIVRVVVDDQDQRALAHSGQPVRSARYGRSPAAPAG